MNNLYYPKIDYEYGYEYKLENIEFEQNDEALDEIVHRAIKRKTGARALRSILEEIISIRDIFPKTLSRRRLKKFRQMGEYSQKYKPALTEEMKIWRTALTAGVSSLRGGSKLKDK